ncbi:SDR family oxidoreductase [Humidisolicoccus flavus]|uniref:SDR family oxidoreductase n=1 Tax=Humidisolicoccus flavus TaxID=3111414 RepID=UPI0032497449
MTRTYVVTGAASGIGATTARLLTESGHTVIGVDLRDVEVTADLSTREGRLGAAKEVSERADGTIDAVIACAGLSATKPITAKVNYFGVTEFLTALLPALTRSSSPRAAVISSMASLHPNSQELVEALLSDDEEHAVRVAEDLSAQGDQLGYLIYSSSKRAISQWVRRESITEAWAGAGIPLNAVAPGIVLTPMTADLLATPEGAASVDASVPMPLNYHQSPESVAELLIWLTSEANTHIAGQTIYIDGGAEVTIRGNDVWSWADQRS